VATLTYVIAGGPDGEARYAVEAPGDGELVFTAEHDDWCRITAGDVEPVVAYMQGRLKVSGDMATFLDLLPTIPLP
jgi:putative sterol carrier protein